ncbi:unnamed protein product [Lactuca virosa]|uniref:Uncharacterized protein n=1 Tax=Lactuca virosa TaxID=75947 RepID=A0AAU9NJ45_9ASTR|nr:unnamed protein product [Lactuca virosa]
MDKFVTKEEFGEMQKVVTSLAQRFPNLETREKTLQESIVKSTVDALKNMEQKRTDDTFKYLDRMDVMLKMVKEIQQSFDDLTNTMGRQHGNEIVPQSFQKVFDLIDDLKGSRFVDEAGEDDNVVIAETSPSPKIDVVSKPQPPPPPPKTTIPPTECEIHESPQFFYDGI